MKTELKKIFRGMLPVVDCDELQAELEKTPHGHMLVLVYGGQAYDARRIDFWGAYKGALSGSLAPAFYFDCPDFRCIALDDTHTAWNPKPKTPPKPVRVYPVDAWGNPLDGGEKE